AFQGTRITSNPMQLIPHDHWMWVDSAYPLEMWCVVPFKKPEGGRLSRDQNVYNKYLSKVCTYILEHAFATLKGCFQSLHEVHLKIQTEKDMKVTIYWVLCCIILHNMIIWFEEEMDNMIKCSTDWAVNEGSGLDDGDGIAAVE
ncbi:hypothetical protein M404DRAFT_93853, partial [Pisolithus tinctorius Marx 270]